MYRVAHGRMRTRVNQWRLSNAINDTQSNSRCP